MWTLYVPGCGVSGYFESGIGVWFPEDIGLAGKPNGKCAVVKVADYDVEGCYEDCVSIYSCGYISEIYICCIETMTTEDCLIFPGRLHESMGPNITGTDIRRTCNEWATVQISGKGTQELGKDPVEPVIWFLLL